jgi:hypothetical protein
VNFDFTPIGEFCEATVAVGHQYKPLCRVRGRRGRGQTVFLLSHMRENITQQQVRARLGLAIVQPS